MLHKIRKAIFKWKVIQFLKVAEPMCPEGSQWISAPQVTAYLRDQEQLISDNHHETLTISAINVDPSHRGKGIGGDLIHTLHAIHDKPVTFVESVNNKRLRHWLERHGFHPTGDGDHFYKFK